MQQPPVAHSTFRSAKPSQQLRELVVSYCDYQEWAPAPIQRRQVPDNRVVLVFSFGDTLTLKSASTSSSSDKKYRSFVAGLHDHQTFTEYTGNQAGLQVNMTALGARRILGPDAAHLSNTIVELDAILGSNARRIEEVLAAAPTPAVRYEVMDAFLMSLANERADFQQEPQKVIHPSVQWAWKQIENSRGNVSMKVLAEEIGWSHRHFVEQFRQTIGFTPKRAARILRFQSAVELLRKDQFANIASVANSVGYADHSHLVREFQSMAGCTPSQFLASPGQ